MFFGAPGKATRLKKGIYLSVSSVLGIILSFIAHAFIEISYLRLSESQNQPVVFYGGCALPLLLQAGLFIAGAVGGFFLGRFWWQKLYIERVWAKNNK